MKLPLRLACSLICAFSIAFAASKPRGDELKAYLDGKKYETDMEFYLHLNFASGKYQIAHMQGIEDSGDYSVRGETITLLSDTTNSSGKRNAKTCKVIWNSKSVAYAEELDCGKKSRYFLDSSKRPEGSEITIAGEPAVVMGKKNAELTTKVVFRKKPSKKGAPMRCENGASPLAMGMNFTVYARTKEKAKVDKWENYWYYVYNNYSPEGSIDPQTNEALGCLAPAGWVFGEFVKFN